MFHHKLATREGRVLVDGRTRASFTTNICLVIHEKCHAESYHSDMKHHMVLNIIFSVAMPNYLGEQAN